MAENPRITVITPTARWGGVDIWKESLQKQTFKDFEALFIDEKWTFRRCEVGEFLGDDSRLMHVRPPRKDEGDYWNLSKSLNWGLGLAKGELIVFLQDYLWLPEDGLQKFWDRYQEVGEHLITGVGHKYKFPEWAVNLTGALTIFSRTGWPAAETPEDHPEHAIQQPNSVWFKDGRLQGRGFHLCNPIEYELNWACAPKTLCEKIGGLDEDFDAGWGYDNVNFAERAQASGRLIWMDESNECFGYSHELLFQLTEGKEKKEAPNNMRLWEKKCEALQRQEIPWKVPYLEEVQKVLCE